MENEFYDIAFRKKLYHSVEELQEDVDNWLQSYNELRPHSGRFCYGKTPMQTFRDTAHIAQNKVIDNIFVKNIRPREDEVSALADISDGRGTAPWHDKILERESNMARIKELEM